MSAAGKGWGFPRWGEYGEDREATTVRVCDFHGCIDKADHPAPKSPFTSDKWFFCERHAAEYNRNWNFFEGMSPEEAAKYAKEDSGTAEGYRQSGVYGWGGAPDDDGYTAAEREAFEVLDMDATKDGTAIKKQFRQLAKVYHPDHNAGDPEAETTFLRISAAYELLSVRYSA